MDAITKVATRTHLEMLALECMGEKIKCELFSMGSIVWLDQVWINQVWLEQVSRERTV